MKTREQYLNKECTHREYYAQFVNGQTKGCVLNRIGFEKLLSSRDEHFNDIPLERWDTCGCCVNHDLMREAGDYLTLASSNCIKKEAARQCVEEH